MEQMISRLWGYNDLNMDGPKKGPPAKRWPIYAVSSYRNF